MGRLVIGKPIGESINSQRNIPSLGEVENNEGDDEGRRKHVSSFCAPADTLQYDTVSNRKRIPAHLSRRDVCSASGGLTMLATADSLRTVETEANTGATAYRTTDMLIEGFVSLGEDRCKRGGRSEIAIPEIRIAKATTCNLLLFLQGLSINDVKIV